VIVGDPAFARHRLKGGYQLVRVLGALLAVGSENFSDPHGVSIESNGRLNVRFESDRPNQGSNTLGEGEDAFNGRSSGRDRIARQRQQDILDHGVFHPMPMACQPGSSRALTLLK
jgi:hypothetical protein